MDSLEAPLSKTQLFVSNLPPEVTDERFRSAFECFGPIDDAFVPVRGNRLRYGFLPARCPVTGR